MKTFKDNAGRTWEVEINMTTAKHVKAHTGVILWDLLDERFEALDKFLRDYALFFDVLYVICRGEADRRKLTDEDFGRSMGGDSIFLAREAFVQELMDFFPDPRLRDALRKIKAAGEKVAESLLEMVSQKLDGLDPGAAARKLIGSPGNTRASSGSTRAHSRSAS